MENTTSLMSSKEDQTKRDIDQESSSKETYEKFRKQHYRQHANDTEHYDHFYKSKNNEAVMGVVILTGDAGVGKSNFLLR